MSTPQPPSLPECRLILANQPLKAPTGCTLYEAFDHPLRPGPAEGRTFVFIPNGDRNLLADRAFSSGNSRNIGDMFGKHYNGLDDPLTEHFTGLQHGDHLFLRTSKDAVSGMQDTLYAAVFHR